MIRVLILLVFVTFSACSDLNGPIGSLENFKGSWKSVSITIISESGIIVSKLPENFHILLVLNPNMTFELVRKADNFLVSDSGNWDLSSDKDSLELFCENGVIYYLIFDSLDSRLKYHSTEFIAMEIVEVDASLMKTN